MRLLFVKNFLSLLFFLCVIVSLGLVGMYVFQHGNSSLSSETTTVTLGDVTDLVTVSAKIEAKNIVHLTFPAVGIIKNVYTDEGEHVLQGDVLASLTQESVVNDYNAAVQNLHYLESTRSELVRGPEESKRIVTKTEVQIAEQDVLRTEREQAQIVQNALEALLSSGLEAIPVLATTNDIPPTITGNYLCTDEGTYRLSVFRSKSPTNHSYELSGLEEGTFTAYTDASSPLGTCGLFIQFDATEQYRNADWVVSIPNTRSSVYLTNLNSYKLALQQQANTLTTAQQALELASRTEVSRNDLPSREALAKIDANIAEARSLVAIKEARIADYTIRAPFNGTVTESNIKIGETATADRGITILQEGQYDLKARIPEIDITNVHVGSDARITFDAKPSEVIQGNVSYISPSASEIDGVAYYEATLTFTENPPWMRAGLNADVKIVLAQKQNVTRVPERFIVTEDKERYVLMKGTTGTVRTKVETGFAGNDGYVEVTNIPEGTEVVLP